MQSLVIATPAQPDFLWEYIIKQQPYYLKQYSQNDAKDNNINAFCYITCTRLYVKCFNAYKNAMSQAVLIFTREGLTQLSYKDSTTSKALLEHTSA